MKKKIILASHGDLAKGMLDTVEMIVGNQGVPSDAYALKPGHHPDEFVEIVQKEVVENPDTQFEIVVDIYGASVCSAFYPLSQYDNVNLFSGMNLNVVLPLFVQFPDGLTKEDCAQLLQDGKDGIQYLDCSEEIEEEDF